MGAQEGELTSLKIGIAFHLGETELTVKQIQDLNPGVVLPIDRSDGVVVDILANGKPIGTGDLVKAGDKLAVRITRLISNE